ncbi:ABC transporter permease [Massilia sp. DWR3-1-1]|uniref:ABC transporter permease n=1 Tax=Massilia sp. DWR3-1-1 TaxID=2804559 RepID=UPI003CF60994
MPGTGAARLDNIYRLGVKELWTLLRDPMMLLLIVYTFSASVYVAATAQPETLHRAAIAIVDMDASPLSARLVAAFAPPQFTTPVLIDGGAADAGLDSGDYTFVLDIPANFQRDLLAGRGAALQLNVDATRMSQAFGGSGYIAQIAAAEITDFGVREHGLVVAAPAITLVARARFNPTLAQSWFGSVMEVINNVTMLSVILTGAALIREREHGTIEHLLVMPVTPADIILAKVWSMGLVVLAAAALSLIFIVRGALQVPLQGSACLLLLGATLHLCATTAMGILMATVARSMPQFGMLVILILLPLQLLSGGVTARESMPAALQTIMQAAPTTHFVALAQAIVYRGAGMAVVWPHLLALIAIAAVLFGGSLLLFRRRVAQMA